MRICSKCKISKELTEFGKQSARKDGLSSHCMECNRNQAKEWQKKTKAEHPYIYRALTKKEKARRALPENREKARLKAKAYRERDKEAYREYNREYKKKRCQIDTAYKLIKNLRCRLWGFFKGRSKPGSASEIGCTKEEFIKHIESKFQPEMTMENYGPKGWHLDHVVPLSSFDLTDREQFLRACHYSNIQPLWWYQNVTKGDKMPEEE